jgi:prolipoprotein diacylglyceryltransferase
MRLRAHRFGDGWRFGIYLALAGMARLFVEIFRAKDDRLLGPFTLAQAASVLVVGVGAWLVAAAQRQSKEQRT